MKRLVNEIVKQYLRLRMQRIERYMQHPEEAQEKWLNTLVQTARNTEFGREYNFADIRNPEDFARMVPVHDYDRIKGYISRMMRGESDVLWPGRCALFAVTSGVEEGQPKFVPMTEEILAHFRRAGRDALLYYTVRVRHAGAFRGRHLLLGGATSLNPVTSAGASAAYAGELSGVVVLNLPAWAEKHLYEPGIGVAKIPDWDARLDAIAAATSTRDITLLAATPTCALLLAQALRRRAGAEGRSIPTLQNLWPNLECFVHGGLPAVPYAAELRTTLGPAVKLHEVYAATEGFIASQDCDAVGAGLRLMTDTGIFFEFLPMAAWDESRLEHLGSKAVPLSGVTTGVDYALVLTTPGGLARYVLGDVVRFTSTAPPRLSYVGRTRLRLHTFGENVSEKEITDTLVGVCHRHKWSAVNFHVAPLPLAASLTGQNRGRHEWWIEIKPGTVETPIGPLIAAELDADLQRANPAYAGRRKSGIIEAPVVRLVMPGVFEHWLRYHDRWGGQHKLPRLRSDRLIADELAQVTNFAQD